MQQVACQDWIYVERHEVEQNPSINVFQRPAHMPEDFHLLGPLPKLRKGRRAPSAGGALCYTYVGAIITATTRRELGIAVNPHLFRDCAVFTVANNAGSEMGLASALLQHTDPRVTEAHYNRGATAEAVRRFHHIVEAFDDG